MNRLRNIILAVTALALMLAAMFILIGIRNADLRSSLLSGIDLPYVSGAPIDGFNSLAFMVAVDRAGATRVQNGPISAEQLRSMLQREIGKRGVNAVLLGVDRACSFDRVWELITKARELGVWRFGFIVRKPPDGQHLWSLDFAHAPPDQIAGATNDMHTIVVTSGGWELNGQTLSLEDMNKQLARLASWRIDNLVQVSIAGAISQDVVAQTLGRCYRCGFHNLVVATRRDNQRLVGIVANAPNPQPDVESMK